LTDTIYIRAGQCSKAGIKAVNEDSCGIMDPKGSLQKTKGIASVVADGVSSSEGGREASEATVIGFLNDYYSTPESWTIKHSGEKVLTALNSWLYGVSQRRYGTEYDMLTTLSVLIIKSATAHLFHVGDTRIYRLRDDMLECLTRDHHMRLSHERDVLSRAMGADFEVKIDYKSTLVEEGDVFLLTTDGVHESIANKKLKEIINNRGDELEQIAREIVDKALKNGSTDNVTCQILKVEKLPHQSEEEFYKQLVELPFPPPLTQGKKFEGYRILRLLHSTKRTELYLASDEENGEKVVIKAPSVNFQDNPEFIDRFLQEEWVGRRINNSHVLKVRELSKKKRFLFYVTEYIDGQSLRHWMHDNQKLSLAEVRTVVEQIVAGLRGFHYLEILHQDLKPENIMIDSHGTLKIVDFGSAQVAGLEEISKPIESQGVLGTVNYTAPEYVLGKSGSPRSDLYSIGVITYELLTGKLPYGERESWKDKKNINYSPTYHHNKNVPLWMDEAIKRAVHPEPAKRYEALSQFIYDIKHPNPKYLKKESVPLLEQNPAFFWQCVAFSQFLLILFLLYLLTP